MTWKTSVTVAVSLFLFFGLVTTGYAERVRIAIPSIAISQIAYQVADEKGYYKEEGLEPEFILMRGPVANVSLIAGEVQFTTVPTAGLTSAIRGAPLQVIFNSYERPMWKMYVKPEIRAVPDLKGKKVGVGGIASATGAMTIEILSRYGLTAGRDVAMVAVGVQPVIVASLQSGAVDAAMLTLPWNFKAEEAGFRELVDLSKEGLWFFTGSVVVRADLVQSKPRLVERFVRATLKGHLSTLANKAEAVAIAVRRIKISKSLAEKTYDLALAALTKDGISSEEGQKGYLNLVAKLRGVKNPGSHEKYFDFGLTRRLNAELKQKGWTP